LRKVIMDKSDEMEQKFNTAAGFPADTEVD
jgi:hypothetical protein